MQPLLVASVPHTGTMFMFDLLPGKPSAVTVGIQDDHKYVGHVGDIQIQQAAPECFTIVPLRDIDAVRDSWMRRGMNLDILHMLWRTMSTRSYKNAFRIEIDNPRTRVQRLNELSNILGCELVTDWQPTNRHVV